MLTAEKGEPSTTNKTPVGTELVASQPEAVTRTAIRSGIAVNRLLRGLWGGRGRVIKVTQLAVR